ncbi:DUF3000 domain-containing protein, partial [Frankia sp. AiPs1]|uniref:DUF3000 domain-containing protein n=1 Tax=Frankia sp. AiPs1 TaxID=573493 RepID=UPI0027E390B0
VSLRNPAPRPDYSAAAGRPGGYGEPAAAEATPGPREVPVLRDAAVRSGHRLIGARPHATGSKPHAPASTQRDQGRRPNVAVMGAAQSYEASPPIFLASTDALRDGIARLRPEISVHEVTAPTRLAPYAFALAGGLTGDAADLAAGRLIVLMDPDGQPAWQGSARVVCYARASVDPEIAADPLLADVAWSWLRESLDAHGAQVRALGGAVTTTSSRRFGLLRAEGDSFDVELRCSWSPDWAETAIGADPDAAGPTGPQPARPAWSPAGAAAHLLAFGDLLAAMAGLPPALSGVVALPQRRS